MNQVTGGGHARNEPAPGKVELSSSCRSSAWRRETSVSWSRIAFEFSRPKATGLDLNSKRLPWSAPWMTNKEATRLSLLGATAIVRRTQKLDVLNLTDGLVSVNQGRSIDHRSEPRAHWTFDRPTSPVSVRLLYTDLGGR